MKSRSGPTYRSISLRNLHMGVSLAGRAALRILAALGSVAAFYASLIFVAQKVPVLIFCSAAVSSPRDTIGVLKDRYFWEESGTGEEGEGGLEENLAVSASDFAENNAVSPSGGDSGEEDALPEVPEKRRGTVLTLQYQYGESGLYLPCGSGLIKNCTEYSAAAIQKELAKSAEGDYAADLSQPTVLIYHTHATECYEPADRGYYDTSSDWHSTDPDENMTAVGDVLAETLKEAGIIVLHDKTYHDYPSYKGSYDRSAVTVEQYLATYPTIHFAIDLHRDAIEQDGNVIIKPTAEIGGRKAAQIMIISGCDDGAMNMPDFFSNLRFAAALQDRMESLYPGLTRPILFDYRKYNMDLLPELLLIEIGSAGNTLSEAEYSAELLGQALISLLK
ncbi:MAG TPA: stage II sporulation protein P [Oscillospiraceae bacterium]|nr:stage II sporulation protein P [Oscillospiraceae bacterium]HRW57869.1 stage II sporulation protein P [Oscillospiraceae bacterium]